ncbi:hypothetical protein LJR225_004975 [Phenylobacterium sp. LjRoot225]|uniref:hypothetical protein n=1 Tax=Phenylobacterium sp. LjRoot225 TaxID=3342285 RepID=UPI003ECFCCDC
MIHHFSIAAKNPQHVAGVIAELWRGRAMPFPPVAVGSWVAFAGDERNTLIEVYPFGCELQPAEGDADATAVVNPQASRFTASHAAVASPLEEAEIFAIAAREGWEAKYRKRGGLFGVVELWLENSVMIEVLTAEMQQEYLAARPPGAPA